MKCLQEKVDKAV